MMYVVPPNRALFSGALLLVLSGCGLQLNGDGAVDAGDDAAQSIVPPAPPLLLADSGPPSGPLQPMDAGEPAPRDAAGMPAPLPVASADAASAPPTVAGPPDASSPSDASAAPDGNGNEGDAENGHESAKQ